MPIFAAVCLPSNKYWIFIGVEDYIFLNYVEAICSFFYVARITIVQGRFFYLNISGIFLAVVLQIIGTLLLNFDRVVRKMHFNKIKFNI